MPKIAVELIPDAELGGFTARVPDIPAYGEGQTEDEAIADLKDALGGYIDTFGLDDALSRISTPSTIRHFDWDFAMLTRDYVAPSHGQADDSLLAVTRIRPAPHSRKSPFLRAWQFPHHGACPRESESQDWNVAEYPPGHRPEPVGI